MSRQIKRLSALLLAIGVLANTAGLAALASNYAAFSVRAVIPENQIDLSLTYFDLRMQPGDKQTVQLRIRNGGDSAIAANLEINPATTGRNGIILYDTAAADSGLALPITEVAKMVESRVVVPGNDEAMAEIRLEMPKQSFDGCILGGIRVTAEPVEGGGENTTQGNGSTRLVNNYVYTVGLKITQNDKNVRPEMHLESIKPELINYRPGVAVNLRNSEAAIVKGMSITGEVQQTGGQAVQSIDMPNVDVAPQSDFNMVVDWGNQALKPGNYRLVMQAEYNDQIWKWDEPFVIPAASANEINSQALAVVSQPLWPYILIGVLAAALIALLILMLAKRRRDRKPAGPEAQG